jgi:nucleoside-diphosphate-sugar epimerase
VRDQESFFIQYPSFRGAAWLQLHVGDVATYEPPAGRFDFAIHGALDYLSSSAGPLALLETSVDGTRRVFEHALTSGVSRVLLLSSMEAYGIQPKSLGKISEEAPSFSDSSNPSFASCEAMRIMEALTTAYGRDYGIESVIARGFSFIGQGLPRHLAITQFINDALTGPQISITGDGEPVRSYLYGADMAVWLLALLVRGKPMTAYNVGSDVGYRHVDAAREVQRLLAPEKSVDVMKINPPPWLYRSLPDISRIRAEVGVDVWTPFAEAVLSMAEDVRSQASREKR